MTNNEQIQALGTTVISTSELLKKEAEITALNEAVKANQLLVAAKDQVIEHLEKEVNDNTKVIIKRGGGYRGNDIIETRNLDSVIAEIKTKNKEEVEEQLGNELIELRAQAKTAKEIARLEAEEREILNIQHREIASRKEAEYFDKLQSYKKEADNAVKEIDKSAKFIADKLRSEYDRKEAGWIETIAELNARLEDKSAQVKLEKEIADYKSTIEELTKQVTSNFFVKLINVITGNTARRFNQINQTLRNIAYGIPSTNAVKTEIPKFFNKYATNEIYEEGRTETREMRHVEIPTRNFWGGIDCITSKTGITVKQIWVKV